MTMDWLLKSYARQSVTVIADAYDYAFIETDAEDMNDRQRIWLRQVCRKAIKALLILSRKEKVGPSDPPACSTQVGHA
jgi:hypothetical protein